MLYLRARHRHGFTLVELMVVIIILGILASTALVASTGKVRRARASEAASNLSKIFQGQLAYLPVAQERGYAAFVDAAPMPRTPPTAARYPSNVGLWSSDTAWTAIGFAIDTPHFYQYACPANETAFTARAVGDLDGDHVQSTFDRVGQIVVPGEVQNFGLVIRNELE